MKNLREKFNNKARDLGNRVWCYSNNYKIGLGHFLTSPITLEKIGATIGALIPLIGLYYAVNSEGETSNHPMIDTGVYYTLFSPLTVPLSFGSAKLGKLAVKESKRLIRSCVDYCDRIIDRRIYEIIISK